jgi:hypothetical protein
MSPLLLYPNPNNSHILKFEGVCQAQIQFLKGFF